MNVKSTFPLINAPYFFTKQNKQTNKQALKKKIKQTQQNNNKKIISIPDIHIECHTESIAIEKALFYNKVL